MKNEKQRVYAFMCKTAPEEYNAKTICRILGVKHDNIRRCLSRLVGEGKVIRSDRGFYRAKMLGEARQKALDQELKCHGIKVEFRPVSEGGSCLPTGPDLAQRGWHTITTHPVNHSVTAHFNFEGRDTILTVFKSYAEVWCHCNERTLPMSFEVFSRWCAFLEGTLGDIYSKWDARVTQIGWNMDVPGMRLEGVKSLRLQTARNAWSTVYQKWKDGTRVETHMMTNMTPEEAVQILKGQAVNPEIKQSVAAMKEVVDKLIERQKSYESIQQQGVEAITAMAKTVEGMQKSHQENTQAVLALAGQVGELLKLLAPKPPAEPEKDNTDPGWMFG